MKSIFDYTLVSLSRFGYKNLAIAIIFVILVWLLSSVILVVNSLKYSLQNLSEQAPSILINKQLGGRYYPLYENDIEPLWDTSGVAYVKGRVWGQYYLSLPKTYITLLSITAYEKSYAKNVDKILANFEDLNSSSVLLSPNLKKLLAPYISNDKVSFRRFDGKYENLNIGGLYKEQSELFSNDVVMMSIEKARALLGLEKGAYTDIIVQVANPNEIDFIAAKLAHKYPYFKLTTKADILKQYELLYQYKSAWFLLIFFVSFLAFAIILYDKSSGLRSEEKKEIGILKALGWEINHIIRHKIQESLIISLGSFLLGLSLAILFVYFLDAPFLKYVFIGYSELKSDFSLPYVFNIKEFALLFFVSVPLYIAVCIIPAWKVASMDANEVLR